jgi:hypothetical protein
LQCVLNAVYTFTLFFSKIHFNVIFSISACGCR